MIVPGQILGYVLADLYGGLRVRRWERRHGLRVAVRYGGGNPECFAAGALPA